MRTAEPTAESPKIQGPTIQGPTIQGPTIQGWCPGALRPMQSGDGWVVRVRPRAGRLSVAQAQGIAALARAHGNGLIDLSGRANVQLRGVTMASHAPLIAGLGALGLLDDSPQAEAQRNVTLAPFWTKQGGDYELALALSAALTGADAPQLSGKFGFAVDLGAAPVLRSIAADIRIERAGQNARVYGHGAKTGAVVALSSAVQCALSLAHWFASSGGIGADGRGRMARFLAGGAQLPSAFCGHPVPPAAPFAPRIGLCPQGALIGFEFGQMQAETLADLATFGALRITPWRMVLIEGARALPQIGGIITRTDDPMLRVIACTGAPACPQGHQPTRPLARQLAPHVPQGHILHISGCAKGCAHPNAAPLTLTATPAGFDLVRSGQAGDTPSLAQLLPDQIPQVLHAP